MSQNRPLEFKAWHTSSRTMLDVAFFTDEVVYAIGSLSPYPRSESEMLQYTGQVDKTGAKIYEGDVLRLNQYIPDEDRDEGETDYACYFYVAFHCSAWLVFDVGDAYRRFTPLHDMWSHLVRVGNQHDNPALMELSGCYPLESDERL